MVEGETIVCLTATKSAGICFNPALCHPEYTLTCSNLMITGDSHAIKTAFCSAEIGLNQSLSVSFLIHETGNSLYVGVGSVGHSISSFVGYVTADNNSIGVMAKYGAMVKRGNIRRDSSRMPSIA